MSTTEDVIDDTLLIGANTFNRHDLVILREKPSLIWGVRDEESKEHSHKDGDAAENYKDELPTSDREVSGSITSVQAKGEQRTKDGPPRVE